MNLRKALIVLAVLVAAVSCGEEPADKNNTSSVDAGTQNQQTDVENSLTVSNQTVASSSVQEVSIEMVTAAAAGFVAVFEAGPEGRGALLGSTSIEEGETTDIVVELDRGLDDGEVLLASLHVDDPADGVFEFADSADPVALDASGDPVEAEFTIGLETVTPELVISDQTVADQFTVVIDRIATPEDVYLGVFKPNDNGGFTLTQGGVFPIQAGVYEDFVAVIEEPLLDARTHGAILFVDQNGSESWEPGTDEILMDAEGNEISAEFRVELPEDPSLFANNQTADPANEVVVSRLESIEPGYVVVFSERLLRLEPDLSNVLGWAPHAAGVSEDIEVVLNRAAIANETLYAVLYREAGGDPGAFDVGTDVPVESYSTEGEMIVSGFNIEDVGASKPFLTMASLLVFPDTPRQLLGGQVIATQPGWLVISDVGPNGEKGPNELGVVEVEAGASAIFASINQDADNFEQVFGELYNDDGDGVFDADDQLADRDGTPLTDTGDIFLYGNQVTTFDQTLSGFSTAISVGGYLVIDGSGYYVIHDGSATTLGNVLGTYPTEGAVSFQEPGYDDSVREIQLPRPVEDGETLWVWLYEETGGNPLEFDPAEDTRLNGFRDPLAESFVVTVPADVPAVRLNVRPVAAISYLFQSAEPERFYDQIVGGDDTTSNPTLTFQEGWRYELNLGPTAGEHPLELGLTGQAGAMGWPLGMGAAGLSSFESDPGVFWSDDGTIVGFTVTPDFASRIDSYRCQTHPMSMMGSISVE